MMKLFFKKNIIREFFSYFWVAIVAFLVNYLCLYILSDFLRINYIISNIISFIFGLTINYILSKKYVFKSGNINKKTEFMIYAFIGVIGLLIDTCVLWFFTEKVHIYHMISKVISTGITFIWNFAARKIFYYFISKR